MKLIILAGLVAIEKHDLAAELAAHYTQAGQRVTVYDNVARLALQPDQLGYGELVRLRGDIFAQLPALLATLNSDVLLLALSENNAPEQVYLMRDHLRDHNPALDIRTVALLDLRTCDCFPQTRLEYEQTADVIVMLPYDLERVIEALA
jgi:hypothetical protein